MTVSEIVDNLARFDVNKHLLTTDLKIEEKANGGISKFIQTVKRALGWYDTAKIGAKLLNIVDVFCVPTSQQNPQTLEKLEKVIKNILSLSRKEVEEERHRWEALGKAGQDALSFEQARKQFPNYVSEKIIRLVNERGVTPGLLYADGSCGKSHYHVHFEQFFDKIVDLPNSVARRLVLQQIPRPNKELERIEAQIEEIVKRRKINEKKAERMMARVKILGRAEISPSPSSPSSSSESE